MAPPELTTIIRELIRFFSARSRTRGQVIISPTNVRQVCGFTDKPAAWMRLTKEINALPSVRKAALYLTPADMADVTTIAQIARKLRKRSVVVVKKGARKPASGRTEGIRRKSKASLIVTAKKGVRSSGRKSVARRRTQTAKEAPRDANDNPCGLEPIVSRTIQKACDWVFPSRAIQKSTTATAESSFPSPIRSARPVRRGGDDCGVRVMTALNS